MLTGRLKSNVLSGADGVRHCSLQPITSVIQVVAKMPDNLQFHGMQHKLAVSPVALIVFALLPLSAWSQSAHTVWNGIYSEIQAERGRELYETNCSSCHGETPMNQDVLLRDWSGLTLSGLFDEIKSSMPADAPGSLSDAAYVDIMAHILQVDQFEAGADELTLQALKETRVEPSNGPGEIPNFALVTVIGCLTKAPDGGWTLANSSKPDRTKDPGPSQGEELKNARGKGLGGGRFNLMNVYPAPDDYKGQRVEVKGFLIREPSGDQLNVTAVQRIAASCDAP